MRILSLLLCLFPLAAEAATLSLREAAGYAIQHSPTLDSSQRQALIAELQRENASAAFLPTLDFTSSHGLQRSYPLSPGKTPWASSFSFNLAENLYDNGESIDKLRLARLQEEASRLSLQRDRDRLLLAVATAFYSHALATRNLEIQQEEHAILKLQAEIVKDAFKLGKKSRKDYLRFQTQLGRADIDLGNAREAAQKTELELRHLLGVPLSGNEQPAFKLEDTRPEISSPYRLPLESHRDFRIAEIQRRVQNLTAAQARKKIWPEINLVAGATYGSSNYIDSGQSVSRNQQKSWEVLLNLKYNILDWGVRRRNVEIASQQAMVQLNSLDAGLLSLRAEIEKMVVDLRQQAENFRLSEELLRLERNNLSVITSEYRQGKVQYLDYITGLQNFASARSTYYSSLYQVKLGLLTQRYHEGTLYETLMR